MSEIPWTQTSADFDTHWLPAASDREIAGTPDILATMFAKQADHMEAYLRITGGPRIMVDPTGSYDLHSPVLQAKIREFAGYTIEELMEAINHLKNKPWKQCARLTDIDAFKKEIGDAWHFFIELMLIAGFNAEDIFHMYFERATSNDTRRETGY